MRRVFRQFVEGQSCQPDRFRFERGRGPGSSRRRQGTQAQPRVGPHDDSVDAPQSTAMSGAGPGINASGSGCPARGRAVPSTVPRPSTSPKDIPDPADRSCRSVERGPAEVPANDGQEARSPARVHPRALATWRTSQVRHVRRLDCHREPCEEERHHRTKTSGAYVYRSRGAAICSNNKTLSEKKVRDAVLGLLRETARLSGAGGQRLSTPFEQHYAGVRENCACRRAGSKQIREAEQRVRNMSEMRLAKTGLVRKPGRTASRRRKNDSRPYAAAADATSADARPKTLPHPKVDRGLSAEPRWPSSTATEPAPATVLTGISNPSSSPRADGRLAALGRPIGLRLSDSARAPRPESLKIRVAGA